MKLFFSIISVCMSVFGFSQVIIGGTNGTAPADKKSAVLLEFEAGQNKGIILPYVRTLPQNVDLTPGTLLLDASENNASAAKMRLYAPNNPNADYRGWVDLSNGTKANLNAPVDYMSVQNSSTELPTAKAVIGAKNSAAKGVLILESNTQTMLLPQVSSTDDIKNPAPGMMVYLNGTHKRLAVYNGAQWTFWEAEQ
ncbi:MAG: hypothetical protein JSS94_07970 [Bacteroidetes bacterium]|nr:hypothetical protein [Bacteroidota bacterium]